MDNIIWTTVNAKNKAYFLNKKDSLKHQYVELIQTIGENTITNYNIVTETAIDNENNRGECIDLLKSILNKEIKGFKYSAKETYLNYKLTDNDLDILKESIISDYNKTNLEILILSSHKLTLSDIICKIILNLSSIRILSLYGLSFQSENINIFSSNFKINIKQLKYLDLGCTKLTTIQIKALSRSLLYAINLEELHLVGNRLKNIDMKYIYICSKRMPKLNALYLQMNDLQNESAKYFKTIFHNETQNFMVKLNLSGNFFTSEGIKKILQISNRKVSDFYFQMNLIKYNKELILTYMTNKMCF